jgi:hypothetical protein
VKHTQRSKACSVPTFPSHLPRPLPSNPFAFPVPRAIYIFAVTTIGTCSKAIVRIASTYLSLLFENTLSMPFLLMWHASTRYDAYHAGTLTQNSVRGPALHHCHVGPTCKGHLQPQAPPCPVLAGSATAPSPVAGAHQGLANTPSPWPAHATGSHPLLGLVLTGGKPLQPHTRAVPAPPFMKERSVGTAKSRSAGTEEAIEARLPFSGATLSKSRPPGCRG